MRRVRCDARRAASRGGPRRRAPRPAANRRPVARDRTAHRRGESPSAARPAAHRLHGAAARRGFGRSEEHTSELQSLAYLVCRLLLEKKKKKNQLKYVVVT